MARSSVEVVALPGRAPAGSGSSVGDPEHSDSLVRDLTALWMAQRVDQGASPEAAARAAAEGRLREGLARPDVRAWLARVDGAAVGFIITSENPFGLSLHQEVAIDQLFVDRRARRHGVAHALIDAVVDQAERSGSEVIVSNVPTQSREANRFFARLGFSSVIVRRVTSTGALRRRLHPEAKPELLEALRRRRAVSPAALRRKSA